VLEGSAKSVFEGLCLLRLTGPVDDPEVLDADWFARPRRKAALEALLNQMVEIDCALREPTKPGELRFKIMNRGEPFPAGREIQHRELLDRPVRTACKHAITLLGNRVHELLGDYHAMVAFAEEVAAGGPLPGHRQSILHWAWLGIGGRHVELPRGVSRIPAS
jgi:hypothetical protein